MANDSKPAARLVAIHGGGDWFDASADYIMLPVGVEMRNVKAAKRSWYQETYRPQLAAYKQGAAERPESFTLAEFAVRFHGATRADIEIEDDE